MKKNLLSDRLPERQHWRSGNMLYPLPAVMVTCTDENGHPNIITIAWTGTVCSDPAMVSISVRPERYSYDLIRKSGEFVINLTTAELAASADFCGVRSGRDLDKFEACGLTAIPSEHVSVPAIAESPVNIECRVTQVIPLGSHDLFLAEVLGVSVDSRYLDSSGRLCLEKTHPVVYSHGEYFEIGERIGKFGFSVRKGRKLPREENLSRKRTHAGTGPGRKPAERNGAVNDPSGKKGRSGKKKTGQQKFSGEKQSGEVRRRKYRGGTGRDSRSR